MTTSGLSPRGCANRLMLTRWLRGSGLTIVLAALLGCALPLRADGTAPGLAGATASGSTAEPSPVLILYPARTPAPLAARESPLALPTEPPAAPLPSGEAWACPAMLFPAVRMVLDGATVAFASTYNGAPMAIVWPRGFSARLVDGRAVLLAPDGTILARDGDVLDRLSGAGDEVCGVNDVIYGPAS